MSSRSFSFARRLATSVCAVSLLIGSSALAQSDKAIAFNITATELASALNQFAHQSDRQIVFTNDVAAGKRVMPLNGTYTPEQALQALLRGSGLSYRIGRDDTIVVGDTREVKESRAPAGSALSQALPLTASRAAVASEANTSDGDDSRAVVEEIIVSGSRIDRSDFDTPTQVVKFSADDLRQGARMNVALALQDAPQFKASNSPSNTGGATYPAISPIDLRGLSNQGQPRTLVLVDGRRYVGAQTYFGGGDLSLIPSSLVSRVDVVMGGASAAWGSGAVAGVANVIIDDKLDGARGSVRGGLSSRRDAEEKAVDLAFGNSFADGRGRLLLGGEFIDSDGITPKTQRANAGRWALVTNPAFTPTNGQQPNLLAPNVGIATASPGGLILSGVNAGRTFNNDGTLRDFNRGRISGSNAVGGESPSLDDVLALVAPYSRYAMLGRLTYDIGEDVKATAEIRHARVYGTFDTLVDVNRGGITINVNNAFLPTAVRNQMIAAGETSFTMGRFNADIATTLTDFERKSTEAVLALDGRFGDNWRWSAYYTHGQLNENTDVSRQRIVPNFNRAIDSVINPANGQPVCRVNIDADLTNNDPACVPFNPFGLGNSSQQARDYVLGTGFFHVTRKLDATGASLRGEPGELWAGPVSVAVGVEGRRDFLVSDVSQLDRTGQLGVVNQSPFAPQDMWTKEGFAEVLLPVLRDAPAARLAELNGAIRVTDDLSGSVWSWKVGATNRVSDDVRLRLAHSRDIRSPAVPELFAPLAQTGLVNVVDPTRGNQSFTVVAFAGRSGPLNPEISNTTSGGITVSPESLPGLSVSADYYHIEINGSIGTVTPQNRVTGCAQGITTLCPGVIRGADGIITRIEGGIVNLTQFKTHGLDGELNYVLPLSDLPGTVRLQSTVNWVRKFQTTDGLSTVSYLGMTGSQFSLATPKVRWNTTLHYEADEFQANVRARFISKSKFDRNLSIQNNDRPAYVYFDLGANWDLMQADRTAVSLYANINNVFDRDPPQESRNTSFYDVVGTYFLAGVRVKY